MGERVPLISGAPRQCWPTAGPVSLPHEILERREGAAACKVSYAPALQAMSSKLSEQVHKAPGAFHRSTLF